MRLDRACEILGIEIDSTREEAVKAYRRLALQHHPDRSKERDATTKFQEVGQAWARVLQYHEFLTSDEGEECAAPASSPTAAVRRTPPSPAEITNRSLVPLPMYPDDVILCVMHRLCKGQRADVVQWPLAALACTCHRLRELAWEHAATSFEAKIKMKPAALVGGVRPQLMLVSQGLSTADGLVISTLLVSEPAMHAIRELSLGLNARLGDPTLLALANAFQKRNVAHRLARFYMHQCSLGDTSVVALAKAVRGGALPALVGLRLSSNRIGWAGANALAQAVEAGGFKKLVELKVWGNQLGDRGMLTLTQAAGSHETLRTLWLHKDRTATKAGKERVAAACQGYTTVTIKC